jgi:hypothetical protein
VVFGLSLSPLLFIATAAIRIINPAQNSHGLRPIVEAWPGAVVDECCGAWPSSAEIVQACCDMWPGFPADVEEGIEVTIKVCLSIGEIQGEHPACRCS